MTTTGPARTTVVTPNVAPMLELRGVRAAYDSIDVLHGIDLVVPAGQVIALLGPNGAGKTTTLKVASGLHPAAARRRVHRRAPGQRRPSRRAGVRAACASCPRAGACSPTSRCARTCGS